LRIGLVETGEQKKPSLDAPGAPSVDPDLSAGDALK